MKASTRGTVGGASASTDCAESRLVISEFAHDLRSPLLTLQMGCDGLERSIGRLNAEQKFLLDHMRLATRHLKTMSENIVAMGRLEAGVADTRCVPMRLGLAIEEAAALVGAEARAQGIAIEAPKENDRDVWADADHLRRVLGNLLGNAIKFSPPGSTVVVRVEASSDPARPVKLAVTDEGPGVPPDQREAVFRPYFRAPGAAAASPGAGLGLAIARALIQRMGGEVGVEGEPGGGAAFFLLLRVRPVAAEPPAAHGPCPDPPTKLCSGR